jgi:outer membrane protein assembly factor BamB
MLPSDINRFMAGAFAKAVVCLALVCVVATPCGAGETLSDVLPKLAATDWPWWRGPRLDGTSREMSPPTKWGPGQNIIWQTPLSGRGHSSPVVVGQRVFLTTAEEPDQKQWIMAYDRGTGRKLWQTLAYEGGFVACQTKNTHASATPACDGERLYNIFVNRDAVQVMATDLEGNTIWRKSAGGYVSEHGYGASPLLYRELVIVGGDSMEKCYIAALDRKTGALVWRTDRKESGRNASYGSPVLVEAAGRVQLIFTGFSQVTSYDPATGRVIWTCDGPAAVTGCTATSDGVRVFATGGFPEKSMFAVRADGMGNVTRNRIEWQTNRGIAYVPSPLHHAGLLYVLSDAGIMSCLDGASGTKHWQERLEGEFTSSPVLAGGLMYAVNEAGKASVFKAGKKFELVAANALAEPCYATPTICGGRIFLRTIRTLYCIGETKSGVKPGE